MFDWNAASLGKWINGPDSAANNLRDIVVNFYSFARSLKSLQEDLLVCGREITNAMPGDLVEALRDLRVKDLLVQVPPDFDFPIELALLEDSHNQWFLQDRVATCRWFTHSKAIRPQQEPHIHKIAIAIGQMKGDSSVEMDVFKPVPEAHIVGFDTAEDLREQVFQTDNFQMLHYFGHMKCSADPRRPLGCCLTFAGNDQVMSVRSIGVNISDRTFFAQGPVIILNCCESARELELIAGRESLPYRLLALKTLACVVTLWPVDSRPANKFMSAFYRAVARGDYVHHAVRDARAELLEQARSENMGADDAIKWTLTARSYVYYGPSDLKCVFS